MKLGAAGPLSSLSIILTTTTTDSATLAASLTPENKTLNNSIAANVFLDINLIIGLSFTNKIIKENLRIS